LNAEATAQAFKALSADTRIRIIQLLSHGPLCVEALAACLPVSQAAVSQHLAVLDAAGLVLASRRGRYVHYRLAPGANERLRLLVDELFQGLAEDERNLACKEGGPNAMECKGKKICCQKPEELKCEPKECSPEQIKECHGESAGHPCCEKKDCC